MDPQSTEQGRIYAPQRYKHIAFERYVISKHTNTSYADTAEITPMERRYLLEFIQDDLQREKEMYDEARAKIQNKNN